MKISNETYDKLTRVINTIEHEYFMKYTTEISKQMSRIELLVRRQYLKDNPNDHSKINLDMFKAYNHIHKTTAINTFVDPGNEVSLICIKWLMADEIERQVAQRNPSQFITDVEIFISLLTIEEISNPITSLIRKSTNRTPICREILHVRDSEGVTPNELKIEQKHLKIVFEDLIKDYVGRVLNYYIQKPKPPTTEQPHVDFELLEQDIFEFDDDDKEYEEMFENTTEEDEEIDNY